MCEVGKDLTRVLFEGIKEQQFNKSKHDLLGGPSSFKAQYPKVPQNPMEKMQVLKCLNPQYMGYNML